MPEAKAKSNGPARPERPRVPLAALIRMFVVGVVAVVASAYAIWRYYTVPRAKMIVPAPTTTEIPAPDLEPTPNR
ncbi:MAG: hypothetical protein FWD69_15485 [Polyangiaceae bacterium]|nr:hypothetical protein [Polyangiaceae bacterium]